MQHLIAPQKSAQQDLLTAIHLAVAYIEFDRSGTILNANSNYLTLSGYTRKELIGRNIKNLWLGEDLISSTYADFWNKLKQGQSTTGVFRQQHKEGDIFWVEAVYHPVQTTTGEPEKIIAFCLDVTEDIQSSKEKNARLEAVDSSLIMASYSPTGEFLEGNENFLSTLGCTEQDLQGENLKRILSPDGVDQKEFMEFWEIARAGRTASGRMCWSTRNAAPVWLHSVFTPVFDLAGNVEKIIQLSLDVTHLANAENNQNNRLNMFSNIVDHAGPAVAITDNTNKTIYVNRTYTNMFGYAEAEILGKFPTSILGPKEKTFLAKARKSLSAKLPYEGEGIAYCKSDNRLWVSVRVAPLFDKNGNREYLIHIFTDITELKLYEILQSKTLEGLACDIPTEQLLEMLCLEIERVMPGLHMGIMSKNKHNCLTLLTTSYYPLKQLDSLNLNIEESQYPSCRAIYSGNTTAENNIRDSQFPDKIKTLFASMNINTCLAAAIKNSSGRIIGVITFYQEEKNPVSESLVRLAEALSPLCSVIMERDENKARMRMLTYYDPLTGLPNRNLLVSGADQLFSDCAPFDTDTSLAALYINIDRFSRINQSHSYEQGNDILRATAGRLMNIKDKQDLVGRMFADQFVIISPHCDAGQAFEKAKRIQNELGKPLRINDIDVSLTASIGISLCTSNYTCMESLINDANNCLLQNRSKGVGRINFFNDDLGSQVKVNLCMEANLRKAIEYDRLILCYQPQVYLGSGKIYGVEALCRWNDKKCGQVPPDQFIPLAEKTGLIEKLSEWVMRESCRQLAEWRSKGFYVPSLSINLSSPSFHDTKLPDRLVAYLQQLGLTPSDIILELTERVFLDENPATLGTVQRAHELGFALSLDDFGTGYSSLSYLRSLPFSEIKLDQSFVRELHTTEVSRRLSEAVMRMGRSLQLTVLAEGVENMDQYRLLKQQNCHAAQGYLLSKPLLPKELEGWFKNWHPGTLTDQHALW